MRLKGKEHAISFPNPRPGTPQIHRNHAKSKAWDLPNPLKSFQIQGLGPSKSIEILPNPRSGTLQIHRNPSKSKAWDPPNPLKSFQIQCIGPPHPPHRTIIRCFPWSSITEKLSLRPMPRSGPWRPQPWRVPTRQGLPQRSRRYPFSKGLASPQVPPPPPPPQILLSPRIYPPNIVNIVSNHGADSSYFTVTHAMSQISRHALS